MRRLPPFQRVRLSSLQRAFLLGLRRGRQQGRKELLAMDAELTGLATEFDELALEVGGALGIELGMPSLPTAPASARVSGAIEVEPSMIALEYAIRVLGGGTEPQQSRPTWDELTSEAQQGLRGQGAIVEAMHRLTVRLDAFSASSDRYSNRMFWLNIILGTARL